MVAAKTKGRYLDSPRLVRRSDGGTGRDRRRRRRSYQKPSSSSSTHLSPLLPSPSAVAFSDIRYRTSLLCQRRANTTTATRHLFHLLFLPPLSRHPLQLQTPPFAELGSISLCIFAIHSCIIQYIHLNFLKKIYPLLSRLSSFEINAINARPKCLLQYCRETFMKIQIKCYYTYVLQRENTNER